MNVRRVVAVAAIVAAVVVLKRRRAAFAATAAAAVSPAAVGEMASPTMVDMMSRGASTEKKMATGKKNWIKKAVPKERRGVFKAKADSTSYDTTSKVWKGTF